MLSYLFFAQLYACLLLIKSKCATFRRQKPDYFIFFIFQKQANYADRIASIIMGIMDTPNIRNVSL